MEKYVFVKHLRDSFFLTGISYLKSFLINRTIFFII